MLVMFTISGLPPTLTKTTICPVVTPNSVLQIKYNSLRPQSHVVFGMQNEFLQGFVHGQSMFSSPGIQS